jgi:hypothetical protein
MVVLELSWQEQTSVYDISSRTGSAVGRSGQTVVLRGQTVR